MYIRTQWTKKIPGGVSALTKALLRQLFIEQRVSEGVRLAIDGTVYLVRVRFGNLLGDEEALSAMWPTKGASGILPCGVGCHVTNKAPPTDTSRGIAPLAARDDGLAGLTCADLGKLGLKTNRDVWSICDMLSATRKEDLASLEHETGLRYEPEGVLFDRSLRDHIHPATSNTYDVMHICWSGGIVPQEMALCMATLRDEVHAYFGDLRDFLTQEGWPISECFKEQRVGAMTNSVRGGATEIMEAYPLMRRFIISLYGAEPCAPHVVSFLLLGKVLDALVSWQRHVPSTADLQELVSCYLQAFEIAYDPSHARPKHHMLLHLPLQIARDGLLLSCFALERKHLDTKASVTHSKSKQSIEETALSRCLNHQVRKLKAPGWATHLVGPTRPFPELAEPLGATHVHISGGMRWRGVTIKSQAVGFLDANHSVLVLVVGCLQIDQRWALLGRRAALQRMEEYWSTWRVEEQVGHIALDDARCFLPTAHHRFLPGGLIEVLH